MNGLSIWTARPSLVRIYSRKRGCERALAIALLLAACHPLRQTLTPAKRSRLRSCSRKAQFYTGRADTAVERFLFRL